MSKFLDQKQKEEFIALIKNANKKPNEVAKIVGVTIEHFSSVLPLNPRNKKNEKETLTKVPAKWREDFDKELELERLRSVVGKFEDFKKEIDREGKK